MEINNVREMKTGERRDGIPFSREGCVSGFLHLSFPAVMCVVIAAHFDWTIWKTNWSTKERSVYVTPPAS